MINPRAYIGHCLSRFFRPIGHMTNMRLAMGDQHHPNSTSFQDGGANHQYRSVLKTRKTTSDLMWSLQPWQPSHTFRMGSPSLLPSKLVPHVLSSPRVNNVIDQLSEENRCSKKILEKQAAAMLEEMAHNQKMCSIRLFGICLAKLGKLLYRDIYVNRDGIEQVRSLIPHGPILLLPSHRSYADFLLMSVISFHYHLPMPVIAAGMDFMNMKMMGELMRQAGAFFIRRSFGSDRLYKTIFTEYVQQLIMQGDHPLEFFLEGTRSRSGKALPPKLGLLSTVLELYLKGIVNDIFVVPVHISYDRTLEESLYAYELLGIPKPPESTRGLMKALSKLQEPHGDIHVTFCPHFSVREFFSSWIDCSPHIMSPHFISSVAEQTVMAELATKVLQSQLKHGVLPIFPLVSAVVLYKEAMDLKCLTERVSYLTQLAAWQGYHITTCSEAELERVLALHSNILEVKDGRLSLVKEREPLEPASLSRSRGHVLLQSTVQKAIPSIRLQHYANQCLHIFLDPCLLILIANCNPVPKDVLREEYRWLRMLLSLEFPTMLEFLDDEFKRCVDFVFQRDLLFRDENGIYHASASPLLNFAMAAFRPFLTTFALVCHMLAMNPGKEIDAGAFAKQHQALVESLLVTNKDELIEKDNFALLMYDLPVQSLKALESVNALLKSSASNGKRTYKVNVPEVDCLINRLKKYVPVDGRKLLRAHL